MLPHCTTPLTLLNIPHYYKNLNGFQQEAQFYNSEGQKKIDNPHYI
jgi:hypothetical protein